MNGKKIGIDNFGYEIIELKEKDILATIKVVKDIIEMEEFKLEVKKYGDELLFQVKNFDGLINLGDIENETFVNLAFLIDRLEYYHNNYFHESDIDKEYDEHGQEVIDKENKKYLMLLENNCFVKILSEITPQIYCKYIKDLKFDKENALDYLIKRYL